MACQFKDAVFRFAGPDGTDVRVEFRGGLVTVMVGEHAKDFANPDHHWKPCVTHAMDLLRHVVGKPAKSQFERKRRRDLKPGLRVHNG